jgi:pimeloyl-ACP methyl ester carboxylesterase
VAQKVFGMPDDPQLLVEAKLRFHWSLACTGKFVWPIPDKGLKKRIHRIQAPTLLVWGKEDRLVAPVYAQEFASRIPGARVELLDQAGHMPAMEHPVQVATLVREFLRGGGL